jgi:hypothetical protein
MKTPYWIALIAIAFIAGMAAEYFSTATEIIGHGNACNKVLQGIFCGGGAPRAGLELHAQKTRHRAWA